MDHNINIDLEYLPKVSFAWQQNAIPVIRLLTICNNSEDDLTNVRCRITSEPEFSEVYEQHISSIPAGKEYEFNDLNIHLNYKFLSEVSEKVRGSINLSLFSVDNETENVIYSKQHDIEVLPYDIWPGINIMPELLAAFSTPNNDAVEYIMGKAAELLYRRTGSSSLSGYQSRDKKYVYSMVNAVYDAIKQMAVSYSNPAVSFEETGQKIRFPHKIYDSKLATCLDFALLFSAVLEQCGLYPLILLHEGHAYAGCHLIEETLPQAVDDDQQAIRKSQSLDEVVVFETTMAAAGSDAVFDNAVAAGNTHILLNHQFFIVLDVAAARTSGITPLPILRSGLDLSNVNKGAHIPGTPQIKASSRRLKETIEVSDDSKEPQTRIDNWKRQLLDLTLRNRLLNFRENKQTIPLACSKPDALEDEIAGQRKFRLHEFTDMMRGFDPRSESLMKDDAVESFLLSERACGRLRCMLGENELNKRLLALFRVARMDLEEGGVNTLFLAIGFLEWLDQGGAVRRAPLIMLPVKLDRQSARHGFYLERYDDDASVNVTLLEMLRRDYQLEVRGVDPPPEDDSGLNVERILQLFRQSIKGMKGWEVKEDVWLSRFSFSKFIMWKDLNDRVDALMQNPVVNHLVRHPGEGFDDGIDGVVPEEIDKHFGYESIFSPMSADSSQLAAVLSAERGKSFVLHGPPGTGKSQTITNMIAHCLAVGKRVLFVSEKRAALEVVHKRLCSIGLEPFCLELHSNKSGKMDVLQQFKKALDFGAVKSTDEWNEVTLKLNEIREHLNGYETELHRLYPCGFSTYSSFAYLLGIEPDPQMKNVGQLTLKSPATITSKEYEDCREICDKLEVSCRQLPVEAFSVLGCIKNMQWTPQWERDFIESVELLKEAAADLKQKYSSLCDLLGFELETVTESSLYRLLSLVSSLVDAPTLPRAFASSGWFDFSENMSKVIISGIKRDELREELADFKYDDIFQLGIASMIKTYENAEEKFFILRWLEQHKITALLQQCRKIGVAKVSGAKTLDTLKDIQALISADQDVKDALALGYDRLGSHWNNGSPEWKNVFDIVGFGNKLHEYIHDVLKTQADVGGTIRSRIGEMLEGAADLLQRSGQFGQHVYAMTEAWNKYREASDRMQNAASINGETQQHDKSFVEQTILSCDQFLEHKNKLREWSLWQKARSIALNSSLSTIVNAIEAGHLRSNITGVFEYRFREVFIDQILEQVPVLRDFLGDEHDLQVRNFKSLDKKYSTLSAKLVVSTLASKLPGARGKSAPKGTAIGLLQRECQKKSRHLSVRKLLEGVQSILHSLKPCMLMSPLSIAQYLPANQGNFDVVIFDEASQIPVWDAIGAIARAPQCVIVGDPKQLPPTNFFSRSDNEEDFSDGDNSFDELESILDECISAGLNNSYLQWHYRSKHESLISFSNYHYYENRLYTFPAALESAAGTSYVYTGGVYDKGKTRTNRKEAESLVAEVVKRLSDPTQCGRSIGIVTFSQAQQALIEDLLDEARSGKQNIEQFFSDAVSESVFVKNLENVQGDERDVIFFSICYAKDQEGRLSMNFGPLNRDGGERRLNVAITRAREEVVVFSSIRAEDIDLSRTKSVGVAHLKSYLKYAEHGVDALANIAERPVDDDDVNFALEQQVADYIKSKGYDVHSRIGCSGYRIDLAVTHPEKPDVYILGVECDGPTYHRSATARDRDQLRQSVLELLGWNIHRLWSTAWWHNSEYAEQKLVDAINSAIENYDERGSGCNVVQTNSVNAFVKDSIVEEAPLADIEEEFIPAPGTSVEDYALSLEYPSIGYPSCAHEQDNFYEPRYKGAIMQQLTTIINNEGPILSNVLHKRICEQWGFGRAGKKIQDVLSQCDPCDLLITDQDDRKIYWPQGSSPGAFQTFRYPNKNDEYKRLICDIPVDELANAMLYVMTEFHSCKEDVLYKEVASVFGISRVTSKSTWYFEAALDNLRQRGVIE